MSVEFKKMKSIPRLSKECWITEKIDGTNATIYISEDRETVLAGSRTRWITIDKDNHGFAKWVDEHELELVQYLPPGWHHGEWWGGNIQGRYSGIVTDKKLSLFNQSLKTFCDSDCPFDFVPVLYRGEFSTYEIDRCMTLLSVRGSLAAPGCDRPEGIVVYHTAANTSFKKTFENDRGKWSKK